MFISWWQNPGIFFFVKCGNCYILYDGGCQLKGMNASILIYTYNKKLSVLVSATIISVIDHNMLLHSFLQIFFFTDKLMLMLKFASIFIRKISLMYKLYHLIYNQPLSLRCDLQENWKHQCSFIAIKYLGNC